MNMKMNTKTSVSMRMKACMQTLLAALVLTAFCSPALAQDNLQRRNRPNHAPREQRLNRTQMAEIQAKYIAQEIALDDQTSQRFVKTFCEFQQEIWALRTARPKKRGENLTEEEAQEMLKHRFTHSRQILDLREKYYNLYSQFLTQKQILRVYQLEKRTMKHLTKRHANKSKVRKMQVPSNKQKAANPVQS